MALIKSGDSLPDGNFAYFDEQDQLQQVSVHSLAAGKKVILFGVPSTFTPLAGGAAMAVRFAVEGNVEVRGEEGQLRRFIKANSASLNSVPVPQTTIFEGQRE